MARQIGVYHSHQDSDTPPAYFVDHKEARGREAAQQAFFINHGKAIRMKVDAESAANFLLAQAVDEKMNSRGSTNASLSARESFLNATGEPRLPSVRAARFKVKAWPFIGDTLAVRVGARV
jgi:hypothetical protein